MKFYIISFIGLLMSVFFTIGFPLILLYTKIIDNGNILIWFFVCVIGAISGMIIVKCACDNYLN